MCSKAYESAERSREAGHLVAAREVYALCAKPACGALRQQCAEKYTQVDADISSIVVVVTDGSGTPRGDVLVNMDGVMLTSELDGKAIPVDPGLHEFVFSADGRVFSTQKVLIVQGQRNRVISASMVKRGDERPASSGVPAAKAANANPSTVPSGSADNEDLDKGAGGKTASDQPSSGKRGADGASADDSRTAPAEYDRVPRRGGPSWFAYTLGGVGLAAVGAGALLTYWGNRDNALLSVCSPNCEPSSVTHIRQMYIASDIAFGGGALAIGVATFLFATSHSSAAPSRSAYGVGVQPARSGALASFAGAF
jgi:hypothetical protein